MEEKSNSRALIEKYSNMAYKIALGYLRNNEDAEDIVQEVLIRLIRNKKKFDCEEHEKNWIIRVTLNLCYNEINSARTQKSILVGNNVELLKTKTTESNFILDIIEKLDNKYKAVFELYYLHDLTTKHISKILKISEMAVRTRLKRARKEIQTQIEKGEI